MKLLVALKRYYGYNYELVTSKFELGYIIISTNEDEELIRQKRIRFEEYRRKVSIV